MEHVEYQVIETKPGDRVTIELNVNDHLGSCIANNIIIILEKILKLGYIRKTKVEERANQEMKYEMEQVKAAIEILLNNIKKI